MAKEYKGTPDSKDLGAWGNDRITVGYVDQVNGPGARVIDGFLPTQHELIQLAKYWTKVAVEIEFDWFLFQGTGSTDIRLQPFAWRRVSRITRVLGHEEVGKAVEEAYDEFGKGCDPRTWRIFRNGTPEEREALRDEIDRNIRAEQRQRKPQRTTLCLTSTE